MIEYNYNYENNFILKYLLSLVKIYNANKYYKFYNIFIIQ